MTTSLLADEQREVVRPFFQRFSAGDIRGDDASYWLATTRETRGMGQLREGLKFVQSRLDGPLRYEIGTMVAEPNKIAVQVEGFGKTLDTSASALRAEVMLAPGERQVTPLVAKRRSRLDVALGYATRLGGRFEPGEGFIGTLPKGASRACGSDVKSGLLRRPRLGNLAKIAQ